MSSAAIAEVLEDAELLHALYAKLNGSWTRKVVLSVSLLWKENRNVTAAVRKWASLEYIRVSQGQAVPEAPLRA